MQWINIVATMKAMHVTLRQIGNSQGFVIPKPILAHFGFEGEAEMSIEGDALVLRKSVKRSRAGWSEAAEAVADAGDDALVMGEFGNDDDVELVW